MRNLDFQKKAPSCGYCGTSSPQITSSTMRQIKMQSPYRAKKQKLSDFIRLEISKADTLEEILELMHVVTRENVEVFNVLKGLFIISSSLYYIYRPHYPSTNQLTYQRSQPPSKYFLIVNIQYQASYAKVFPSGNIQRFRISSTCPLLSRGGCPNVAWSLRYTSRIKCCIIIDIYSQFITDFTHKAYEIVRGSHGAINKGNEIRRNLYIQMVL